MSTTAAPAVTAKPANSAMKIRSPGAERERQGLSRMARRYLQRGWGWRVVDGGAVAVVRRPDLPVSSAVATGRNGDRQATGGHPGWDSTAQPAAGGPPPRARTVRGAR